tara:strand:- start:74 stop:202 length:129 start_codon:yes stop_codon:yes gene_type:complete
MKREIDGYYFDGEKSWIIYVDEDGNTEMEEWVDKATTDDRLK